MLFFIYLLGFFSVILPTTRVLYHKKQKKQNVDKFRFLAVMEVGTDIIASLAVWPTW